MSNLDAKNMMQNFKVKFKLFSNMFVAAVTAGLAIYISMYFTMYRLDYMTSVGIFLAYRVCAFMANLNMKLTDDANISFMSSERILWNQSTIAIALVICSIFVCVSYVITLIP